MSHVEFCNKCFLVWRESCPLHSRSDSP
jgi:hypothetical protein